MTTRALALPGSGGAGGNATRSARLGRFSSLSRTNVVSPELRRNARIVLSSRHHAQRPHDGVPCRIRCGYHLRSNQPDLGVFLSDRPLARIRLPVDFPDGAHQP